jgi:NADH-quinone oxidoreductase subunit J
MSILFYSFTSVSLVASLFVVFSSNPVYSVLSLILVFCSASMVLLVLTVDFLSILFIVVYVGAIAVLFLFVIMMLNIKLIQISESVLRWVPLGFVLTLVFTSEVFYIFDISFSFYYFDFLLSQQSWLSIFQNNETLSLFGGALYLYFFFAFILAAFVLLTALLGAIVLTVNGVKLTRRQVVYKQVGRGVFDTISFFK